jgi:hypothetical protein
MRAKDVDLLNLEVGRPEAGRTVVVKEINLKEFKNRFGRQSRIVNLVVQAEDGYEFEVTSAFMTGGEGEEETMKRTLFLDLDAEGKIRADSHFAQFLAFFHVSKPSELIGRTIQIRPNSRGHQLAVAVVE